MHKPEVSHGFLLPRQVKKTADKAQEKYWKLQHSPKNEDDYMVTSDAELGAKLVINLSQVCKGLCKFEKSFDLKKKRGGGKI
uniref:Uncharacterized protein n=1 Tax=Cyanoderma ruficeps TaxID=181631 RepID=A0A8C3QGB2_9PASS